MVTVAVPWAVSEPAEQIVSVMLTLADL